jgi:hypothetical protein
MFTGTAFGRVDATAVAVIGPTEWGRPNGARRIFTHAAMHEWFGEPGLAP